MFGNRRFHSVKFEELNVRLVVEATGVGGHSVAAEAAILMQRLRHSGGRDAILSKLKQERFSLQRGFFEVD
jgi:c-di-AMP phosphodiesterase-like protein